MCSSEMITVEIEGKIISCSYITPANSTNDTLLLFLHDALGCSESWKDFPSTLCQKMGSVGFTYDRVGHGKSAATTAKWSKGYLEAEADFLKKIIATQNLKNVVLIGSSDGGSIALLYAAKYQDCKAIVSIAGHSKVEEETTEGIQRTIQNSEKIISQLKKYHDDKTSSLFQNWQDCWLSADFKNWNIETELLKIQCPSLIIQGKQDEYATNAHCKSIAQLIGKKAKVVLIDDCGHFPYKENPSLIAATIHSFLNSES
ncbi:alpha/beta fold hydrolase [Flavobacterium frigoris]|uniref:Hydrolase-related protein n=1 Tax=Flavobacterium frigoris (strain PS1) TaxID=1086011 RepID=H7FQS8_FLAFP|nr:alpha/beta hydrolase [Flavobacterium frigoris]EIA09208.1 hydrolase-related protein [Flavobacterium frigoris PS1]